MQDVHLFHPYVIAAATAPCAATLISRSLQLLCVLRLEAVRLARHVGGCRDAQVLDHQVKLPLQILHLSLHRGDHVDLHLCALDVSRVAALLHAGLELGDDVFNEAALAAAAGCNRNILQLRLGAAAARRVLVDGAKLAIWEAARVRITETVPPEDNLLRLEVRSSV